MINRMVSYLAYFFVGLVELFMAVRVVMEFFKADPANGFVAWVYASSTTLMEPFRGTFTRLSPGHNHLVDFPALFVMIAYGIVILAFLALSDWLGTVGLVRNRK